MQLSRSDKIYGRQLQFRNELTQEEQMLQHRREHNVVRCMYEELCNFSMATSGFLELVAPYFLYRKETHAALDVFLILFCCQF